MVVALVVGWNAPSLAAPTPEELHAAASEIAARLQPWFGEPLARVPDVVVRSDAEYERLLPVGHALEALQTTTFLGFGVIRSPDEVLPLARQAYAATVGYQDRDHDRIVLRDRPQWRQVLMHEITHAYQFPPPASPGSTDDQLAYLAVDEAIAQLAAGVLVTRASGATFSASSLAAAEQDAAKAGATLFDKKRTLLEQMTSDVTTFRAEVAHVLVTRVARQRGLAAAMRLFRERPRTTVELLDPDRWFGGARWSRLTLPPVDALGTEVVTRDVFGALRLGSLVGWCVNRDVAWYFARAWRGDSYAVYADDRQVMGLTWAIELATDEAARHFVELVDQLNACRKRKGHGPFDARRLGRVVAVIGGFSGPDRPRWLASLPDALPTVRIATTGHGAAPPALASHESVRDRVYRNDALGLQLPLPAGHSGAVEHGVGFLARVSFRDGAGSGGGLVVSEGDHTHEQVPTGWHDVAPLETKLGSLRAYSWTDGTTTTLSAVGALCDGRATLGLVAAWKNEAQRRAVVEAIAGVAPIGSRLRCQATAPIE